MFIEGSDEFASWEQGVKERRARRNNNQPLDSKEAWDLILKTDGLWILRKLCEYFNHTNPSNDLQVFHWFQTKAAVFVQFGRELAETAYNFDRADTLKLWEIFAALQLQLRTLDTFSLVYSRKYNEALDRDVTHSWGFNLQQRVVEAERTIEEQGNAAVRSPAQHLQDNLILQTVVGLVILSCIYPLVLAVQHSPSSAGSTSDADFYSQITSSIMALAGFFTIFLPVYRETKAKEWAGTWILTVLGSVSALIAIPLYPLASVSASVFCGWLAASCQLLVLLQVSLIAGFKRNEHMKKD